jgi:heptosyltransferase I
VRGHRSVDEILIFDRAAGWRGFLDIRRELAARRFDLVINLQVYFKAGVITSFANAPVKLGFDRARARDANWLFTTHRIPPHVPQHVQDQYFEFLTAIGVAHEPVVWDLGPWPGESTRQDALFAPIENPVASIVVATSKPQKDWLPERWAEVVDALWHDFGLESILVGGTSERERTPSRSSSPARATSPCRRSAAACGISSASSTARRSCSRPTPGRCTWPLLSTGPW